MSKVLYQPEILVTGATGFVGQRLCPLLIKKFGVKNILFLSWDKDNSLTHTSCSTLKKLRANIMCVDLLKPRSLVNLPKKPKLVIHLAANTNTSLKNHQVNNQGVQNLYKAIGPLNKDCHFIHISTMVAVVGRPDTKNPVDENSSYYPTNEYTRTKAKGESYLIKKSIENNFRLTVLIPNTIYGRGVRHGSLLDMLESMVEKDSFITRLNWPGKSALIHVDDVIKAIVFFCTLRPRPGKPTRYLLYSENLSISDIARVIYEKNKTKYIPINLPKYCWKLISHINKHTPILEPLMLASIYNTAWRMSIITDNVVFAKSNKLSNIIPKWEPKRFRAWYLKNC